MKAVFLDRDGVINVDHNYVYKISDLEFYPGSIQGMKTLQNKGFLLIIITNQSGIGRGYYSKKNYLSLKKEMHTRFKTFGLRKVYEYACFHAPEENCSCRKPNILFIKKAIERFTITTQDSFFIGDKTSDIKAGKDAGLKTVLVKTGKGGKDKLFNIPPDYICKDLYDASIWIAKQNEKST